ncbi:MAG: tRNA(Ile)-lysidine synthetase, partial [Micrococcaceae bacterium]|nr:tRNA(Ile)-lysidine synthetase [Micrococcaceae bacterium]
MGGHLPPALARARRAILDSVGSPDPQRPPAFVLIGCSGGADSLALAAAAAGLVGAQGRGAGAGRVAPGLPAGRAGG